MTPSMSVLLLGQRYRVSAAPDALRCCPRAPAESSRRAVSLIEIFGLDHVEAGELLLRFGERAIGDRELAVSHAHRRRGVHRLERFGCDAMSARAYRRVVSDAILVGQLVQPLFVQIYKAEVFH
jgi:hypothetical protein